LYRNTHGRVVPDYRFAQLRDSSSGCVLGLAFVKRSTSRRYDRGRGLEIGFTDLEMHHSPPQGFVISSPFQHFHDPKWLNLIYTFSKHPTSHYNPILTNQFQRSTQLDLTPSAHSHESKKAQTAKLISPTKVHHFHMEFKQTFW
jgi:hypothetical protein